jgi:hypothetical protein
MFKRTQFHARTKTAIDHNAIRQLRHLILQHHHARPQQAFPLCQIVNDVGVGHRSPRPKIRSDNISVRIQMPAPRRVVCHSR